MSETTNLELPLVQAAQAQKHVTVNEALVRLDAAIFTSVLDWNVFLPPVSATEGDAYIVGEGATGAWAAHDQKIAVFSYGGWVFLSPKVGWRAWNTQIASPMVFDGVTWAVNAVAVSGFGAVTTQRIIELDHTITAGADSLTINAIPAYAQLLGVTARVTDEILGAGVATWSLGVVGDEGRFANGLGLAQNSYALGMSGTAQTYWADTALLLTPDAGTFTSGQVRFAVHVTELTPPRTV